MRIALVVYEGVLDDECEAFRSVLSLVHRADVVSVGATRDAYPGPGGSQTVDLTFDELLHADVVVVPGGLGCERAADDPQLREFLLRIEGTARYIGASSTGSVVLASAGLLHGEPAATHWLANDLLRRYGSDVDGRRLVVAGKVITCEGRLSAVDAAFTLAERLEGSDAVDRIRATLLERGEPLLRDRSRFGTWLDRLLGRAVDGVEGSAPGGSTSDAPPPVTPLSVMVELIDDDELVRTMKRRANRRRPS